MDLGKHVPSLVLAPVVGLGAAISSAADLIEEEVMLLDVFHEGYKHRSCLGVDPREKPFTSSFWLSQRKSIGRVRSRASVGLILRQLGTRSF